MARRGLVDTVVVIGGILGTVATGWSLYQGFVNRQRPTAPQPILIKLSVPSTVPANTPFHVEAELGNKGTVGWIEVVLTDEDGNNLLPPEDYLLEPGATRPLRFEATIIEPGHYKLFLLAEADNAETAFRTINIDVTGT